MRMSPRKARDAAKARKIADGMAERLPEEAPVYDAQRTAKASRKAREAADRLLEEIDDFLKQGPRKP